MKQVFRTGDCKRYCFTVKEHDVAIFEGKVVHPVCATFTLAREIEWATRQYVLEMKEEDEEGIGTFLLIDHKGPAFVGDEVCVFSSVMKIERNEILCYYEAKVGDRLVAMGETGQKILKKEKIGILFDTLKK
jgi:fluoroacetyl-CoA thioesterase